MRQMASWLLVALSLGAAPQLDLVLTGRTETTAERADDVVLRVREALEAEGLHPLDPAESRKKVKGDPLRCGGKRACAAKLGKELGSTVLVTVEVSHLGDRMAVSLEAVSPDDAKRLAQRAFALSSLGYPAGLEPELKGFAQAVAALEPLKAALETPPVPVADAPVKAAEPAPDLLPPPPPPPPVEISTAKPRPWGLISTTLAAGATAVAALVFLTLGLVNSNALDSSHTTFDGQPASTLTHQQALGYANDANTDYTVSLVTGLGAVALAGVSAFLWRSGD
jgi:hypothetical protein